MKKIRDESSEALKQAQGQQETTGNDKIEELNQKNEVLATILQKIKSR